MHMYVAAPYLGSWLRAAAELRERNLRLSSKYVLLNDSNILLHVYNHVTGVYIGLELHLYLIHDLGVGPTSPSP